MDTFAPIIGTKLRNAREFKNYSQEYMAESLGVSQSTYGRWEKGEVLPKLDMLEKAAGILELPLQALFNTEPFVLTQQNNTSAAAGYIFHQHNHVPSEVVTKMLDQHREHMQQLEALCNRLTDIIEKRLK
ncbi:MAG TPA: helix-turn-helix transcriptional regulator [Flavobacteriales bacterium]|nr:helix-turn-helix transcriptional regulator [Flavobacteriales bacterium]